MLLYAPFMVLVGSAISIIRGAQAAPCPASTVSVNLTTAADLQDLRDAMNCSGRGYFSVAWKSSLQISQRIEVTDYKTVRVTGSGYPTISYGLPDNNDDDNDPDAIINDDDAGDVTNGGSTTGMFLVSNGSNLTLSNLVLDGGYSDGEGAIAVHSSSILYVFGCAFTNNTASIGGAIYANRSEIHIDGASSFTNNSAEVGGAMYADGGSEVIFQGSTSFAYNSASYFGGATYTNGGNIHVEGDTFFYHNSAEIGGAIYADNGSEFNFDGYASFSNNSAKASGGAICAHESAMNFVGETSISHNSADFRGGAIYAFRSEIHTDGGTHIGNNDADFGGAIYSTQSRLDMDANTYFLHNSALEDGGAILANHWSDVSFDGNTTFAYNKASDNGGVVYSSESQVHISGTSFITHSASFIGGGFYASGSLVTINGTTAFSLNSANDTGGAIWVEDGSELHIEGKSSFSGNYASTGGGAIFTLESEFSLNGENSFLNNSATLGGRDLRKLTRDFLCISAGALGIAYSRIIISGTTRFHNNDAEDGGAVLVAGSEMNMDGTAIFEHNSASSDGGAMFAYAGSQVNISGNTSFAHNSVLARGGAFFSTEAEVRIDGTTLFRNNSADAGGAMLCRDTKVDIGGTTTFSSNSAIDGGAMLIYVESELNIDGNVLFDGNRALNGGGIASLQSGIRIASNTYFDTNSARSRGGAIRQEDGDLTIVGDATLMANSASFGGGIYVVDGNISISGGALFTGNVAEADGGGISMTGPTKVNVSETNFTSNTAELGGAISLGSPEANMRSYDKCKFSDNIASDGGALYLFGGAGADAVIGSVFRDNHASASGGAIYLVGGIILNDSSFVTNTAGEGGAAITSVSLSSWVDFGNVSFLNNAPYCPIGEYGNTRIDVNISRFDTVCGGCSTTANEVPIGVQIQQESGTPVCEELPTGTIAHSSGTTVTSLALDKGYYRTSNKSTVVLECYRQQACAGGDDPGTYCAAGYEGAYCSVCANDFSSGMAYSCRECSREAKMSALGILLTAVVIVLVAVGLLLRHLGRAEDDETREGKTPRCHLVEKKCAAFQEFVMNVLPLTAIKIVVVVLQIVSQFSAIAGDVYPKEYEVFLSYLSFANFDIGVMMSYSCLFAHDFYGRLLLATIVPLVVLAVLAGASALAQRRTNHSNRQMDMVRGKHLSAALFFAFFVYSSVSYTVFQTYICDSLDDGEVYLQADYSLKCTTKRHSAYTAYASLMVVVYPIGIPAFFCWWLVRNRQHLKMPDRQNISHLKPFSNIWGTYTPSRYYYEVVECCRRVTLTMASVFLIPNTVNQIAVVLSLAVAFLFISEWMSPFESSVDMSLYRWGNGVVLASMYVALLIKANESNEKSGLASVFGAVLIVANVFMIAAVLAQTVLLAKTWSVSKPNVEKIESPVPHSLSGTLQCTSRVHGSPVEGCFFEET